LSPLKIIMINRNESIAIWVFPNGGRGGGYGGSCGLGFPHPHADCSL
jgi:hypothetical protein